MSDRPVAPSLPPVVAAALASEQPALSAVEFGAPGAPPLMAVAAAVRGGRGQALPPGPAGRRVLVATLSLEVLSHLLPPQFLEGGQPAPLFVLTGEGQVVAHSEPGNIGHFLSLPGRGGTQRVEGDSVVFESPGGGRQRLLIASTRIWGTNWSVVAVQPLTHLLAQVEELRRTIRSTAEAAANEMAREAGAQASRLEAAAVQEQRRVTEETALRVRRENQEVARAALAALVRQQNAMAHRAVERMKRDSRAASQVAALAMVHRADQIAQQSDNKIRSEAARRARLSLASMHAVAGQTADRSARRIAIQSGVILAVAMLVALMAALLTAQSAVRPITALAAGAHSIAQGDFSHRVRIRSQDELGELAASFNQMGASIEASREELQASNASLAQEKRRIQTIVDNSPDGLLILNEDGRVGYANPAARSLLPWRAPAAAAAPTNGSLPLEAVLPASVLRSLTGCLERIESGDVTTCDLVLPSPRRVVQVRSVSLESASAGLGRLIHLHDVTREREIDEMRSNFVMLVSHELRTPLTSILGFSSYMLTGKLGPLTEAQRSAIDSMQRQAQRLKAIAADFLDLARIDAGRLRMRREVVDLERVSRRVLEELSPQARERKLSLRMAGGHEESALVVGDEARISQILMNLIDNGIKFTEEGGVEVALLPGPEDVRVEVRDTGVGIPPEEQARVFDRFYQVEGVVTRHAGGTGLGLSIVRNLVEAHGGQVGVMSRGGAEGGTVFYFTLPAASQEAGGRAVVADSERRLVE